MAALVLNVMFLRGAWAIWRRSTEVAQGDGYATEKRVFRFSLMYLFLMFGALLADASLRLLGWGIW